ncbi:MFS transporter [Nocardia carnea]|uniref:MFS transporter n=1 Tax=Nocardia carnea TaxID=37328 RepID=UPI0024552FF1|nr:MFS transporter [Nocardia carnea]
MLDVLGHRVFRRLFTAQTVALAGTGLLTVALGLLAYDLAGANAGAVLGTALAIKMLAYVIVAPVIAAMTERLPRRPVLVAADLVRAVIALGLPLVDQVWQIYALIFVLQAASATFTPAFQSIIPSVLPAERDYTRALSISRLAYDLEAVLSPLLAAAALTVMGYHWLFLGTVAGFLGSALLVVTTTFPTPPAPQGAAPLTSRILAGTRIMCSRPVLRGLLALNLVVAAGTGLVLVNTVVYVHDLLRGSDTGVAIALGCFGAGSILAALAVPRLLIGLPDRTIMFTGAGAVPTALAATTVLLATAPSPEVSWATLTLTWIALGAATSLISTPTARLLRYRSREHERTAVFTAQFSLSHACFLLTYPLAGWVGAHAGHAVAAATLAAVATLAASTAARLWPAHHPATPVPAAAG